MLDQSTPGTEQKRLGILVGKWHTTGWTAATPSVPALKIDAYDTYSWLPGGFGLLHVVDAHVGETKVEGAEIIGYDPSQQRYSTLYYGSDGPTAYTANLTEENGASVWKMQSEKTRFTGTFSEDGNTITGFWEFLDDKGNWQRSMDITLVKTDAGE